VKRQLIPKRGGGVRELGIPTVLDRFVQQLLLQVLQPMFDPTFSEHSHGFRPGRRAHDAVCEAQRYIQDGRRWVVDACAGAGWHYRRSPASGRRLCPLELAVIWRLGLH